jgi:hypothetical protein
VCRRLGIPYLSVDRLCILQDDTLDKSFQIAQMHQIYRNASLTIAAAAARTVREGFLHQRTAAEHTQDVFELPYCGPDADGTITLLRTGSGPEPIDERAWTLQERLLPPKTFEFGTRQVRWICRHAIKKIGYTDGWRRDPEFNPGRKDTLDEEIALEYEVWRHEMRRVEQGEKNTKNMTLAEAYAAPNLVADQHPISKGYRLVETYTTRKLSNPIESWLS